MKTLKVFAVWCCLSLAATMGDGADPAPESSAAPWADRGLTTFEVLLQMSPDGSGYGLRLYQRWEEYMLPSAPGDALGASTAVFPVVAKVNPGSPAERAGLRVGDHLLTVNGESVSRQPLDKIRGAIRARGDYFQAGFWRRAPYWPTVNATGRDRPRMAPARPLPPAPPLGLQEKHGLMRSDGASAAAAAAFAELHKGVAAKKGEEERGEEGVEGRHRSYVVTLVAYNRPEYFRQVLAALGKCRGVEKYTVMMFLEPVSDEVVAVAKEFEARGAAKKVVVHVNPVKFGFPHNLRQAVEVGFTQADYVILVEDDIVLAPDALEYFEWARDAYQNDPEVFTVSAYGDIGHASGKPGKKLSDEQQQQQQPEGGEGKTAQAAKAVEAAAAAATSSTDGDGDGDGNGGGGGGGGDDDAATKLLEVGEHHATARRRHFTPWGWAMWADRYTELAHIYTGWDAQMNFHFRHLEKGPDYSDKGLGFGLRGGRKEVFPLLSRSNNIGFKGGIHAHWFDEDEMKAMQHLERNTAAEVQPLPGDFHELTDEAVLSALCARCGALECGRDTMRGLCEELGVMQEKAKKKQWRAP
jgi:hypothetical protein